ncbi:DeoR family transcriptional regulator [Streptomyces echinatus]|uniref:DeoR family transcriptional regulator n=1 Tax=Streptomyces echinatus TaxID=67293 RepID=UPI003814B7FD
MATATNTAALDRAARRAIVRRLADEEQLSARAIARRLGAGKDTVRRDLEATAPTSCAGSASR